MKAGDFYHDKSSSVKVCAVADGYVMARRIGCAMFLNTEEMFLSRFEPGKRETDLTKKERAKLMRDQ